MPNPKFYYRLLNTNLKEGTRTYQMTDEEGVHATLIKRTYVDNGLVIVYCSLNYKENSYGWKATRFNRQFPYKALITSIASKDIYNAKQYKYAIWNGGIGPDNEQYGFYELTD